MPNPEEEKTCAQCRHFRRHYVCEGGRRFVPLNRGHCGAPRIRDKDADTPACGRFSVRPEGKKAEKADGCAQPSAFVQFSSSRYSSAVRTRPTADRDAREKSKISSASARTSSAVTAS